MCFTTKFPRFSIPQYASNLSYIDLYMAENRLYFDPQRNMVTANYSATCHEITKAEVPALVAKGAEVDQSARDLNQLLKDQERSQ